MKVFSASQETDANKETVSLAASYHLNTQIQRKTFMWEATYLT